MAKPNSFDMLVKMLIIGDSGVGKSNLLLRFSDDSFTTSFITTIGIDFKIKTIEMNGKKIKLQIWDTAGQERFRTITSAYYRGSQGVIIVFDVSNADTFHNVERWIRNIEDHASEDIVKVLVGNKIDMQNREIETAQAKAFAKKYDIPYYECSALKNINVKDPFLDLTKKIHDKLMNNKKEIPFNPNINPNPEPTPPKKCCN